MWEVVAGMLKVGGVFMVVVAVLVLVASIGMTQRYFFRWASFCGRAVLFTNWTVGTKQELQVEQY